MPAFVIYTSRTIENGVLLLKKISFFFGRYAHSARDKNFLLLFYKKVDRTYAKLVHKLHRAMSNMQFICNLCNSYTENRGEKNNG